LNPLFEKAVIESSGHSSGGHSDDSLEKKMKMNKKRKLADYLSSTYIASDHPYSDAKRLKTNYV